MPFPTAKQFVNFLAALPAEEGETLLLTRNTPKLDDKGQKQYHADGVVKGTYPAFLPKEALKRMKEGDSWYVNTGSFVLDRMTERAAAKTINADYVLFMMLDDVDTAKAPNKCPLEPTWIMETSEGSFQWGYVFSEQPTVGEYAAAIKACGAAGYTDPGAKNAVRNCRVPGSVNMKRGRNGFQSRLVAWNEENEYTLDQLLTAMNVVPGPPITNEYEPIKLRETGKDRVLKWLSDQGLVLSSANEDGWLDVVCPNSGEHSDGNPSGRYNPIDRSYCCWHGHCDGFDSAEFLAWVQTHGGPPAQPGVRDDLIGETLKAAFEKAEAAGHKIEPNEIFTNVAEERSLEAQKREMARVERSDWFSRFGYVELNDGYFDMETRREITRANFDATFRGVETKTRHADGKKQIRASHYFDERRTDMGAMSFIEPTYAPGEEIVMMRNNLPYCNTWVDARPDVSKVGKVSDKDIQIWLDHCRVMVPDEAIRERCFDLMAVKLQEPKIKINHAILHGGTQGSGKDTMWAPIIWAIGGPGQLNYQIIDSEGMKGDFHYDLEGEIVVLNEMKEPEAAQRRVLANKLKPIIAAPPMMLRINRKNLKPYKMLNRIWMICFTNFRLPLSLESEDRRFLCIWSEAPKLSPEKTKALWSFYNGGGFEKIAAWLKARKVADMIGVATNDPPSTEWKESMIENGRSNSETYLLDEIRDRRGSFEAGIVAAPWNRLLDLLHDQAIIPQKVNLPQQALLHALEEAGWKCYGRLASAKHPNKKEIYALPEVVEGLTKSQIRDMIEDKPATNTTLGHLRAVA